MFVHSAARSTLFARHKRTLLAIAFVFIWAASVSYAVPPTSPYQPGETLDPSCAPGETNCTVSLLPTQTGHAGQFLTTNGNTTSWAATAAGYTDEEAQDAIATLIQNGVGITLVYNDTANTLTPTISLAPFNTSDLSEGANLYYTNARALAALTGANISLFTNDSGYLTTIAGFTTDDLTEGSNLYYTDERFNTAGDTRYPKLSASYTNPSWITSLPWSKITATPTTLAGYGITDGAPISGSANYIQNQTASVQIAGLNISGNGLFGGSVGIGTTSPSTVFEVRSNDIKRFQVDGGYGIWVNDEINGGTTSAPASLYFNYHSSGDILLGGLGGSVGIGTAHPTTKLYVEGSGAFFNTTSNYGLKIYPIGNTLEDTGVVFESTGVASGNGIFKFTNELGELVRITGDGKVGIGTTSPSAKLHVQSTTEQLRLGYDTSNYAAFTVDASSNVAIVPGTSTTASFSFGYQAGKVTSSNFLGYAAGSSATNASYSNFFGYQAGKGATNASASNFLGYSAGIGASSATSSNFIGSSAGSYAMSASNSNFIGESAGYQATNAQQSNFFGNQAGSSATSAFGSNFLGYYAGFSATNASYSNFLGYAAGRSATNAKNSIFIGQNAGNADTVNNTTSGSSILIGANTNTGGFSNSIGLGAGAINTASNQLLIGSTYTQFNMRGINYTMPDTQGAGVLTNDGSGGLSWIPGGGGGSQWTDVTGGINYEGGKVGIGTITPTAALHILKTTEQLRLGYSAGTYVSFTVSSGGDFSIRIPENRTFSVGLNAGYGGSGSNSNFIGKYTGYNATSASNSNFLGSSAGYLATNASNSNFFGNNAGYQATNAQNSIFIGQKAGNADTVNNTTNADDFSILIGKDTSTGGFSNSIAIGGSAVNTASNQFVIGSATRPINEMRIVRSATRYASFGVSSAGTFNIGLDSTATNSFFFGASAGYLASSVTNSNFFGTNAGFNAVNASNSNFLGQNAGSNATNTSNSNFLGYSAGAYATNASNSIFIGQLAGYMDTVNNTTNTDDFSILIGKSTSTGGFSNSIALGGSAVNTASNQFMIGSATRPITQVRINSSSGAQCTITTGTGIACTSDYRLKNDIETLDGQSWSLRENITTQHDTVMDRIMALRPVTYTLPSIDKRLGGFIAQEVEPLFPDVVQTDNEGWKSMNYAGLMPYTIAALQEMNMNITSLEDLDRDNTWRDSIMDWLGSATNGITRIFSKKISTDELCVGEVCVTESEFMQMVQHNNGSYYTGNNGHTDQSDTNDDADDTSTGEGVTNDADIGNEGEGDTTAGAPLKPGDNTPADPDNSGDNTTGTAVSDNTQPSGEQTPTPPPDDTAL